MDVEVVSGERRYPDNPDYKWELDGVEVTLATITGEDDSLEVRVDTPRGEGSFWASLNRAGRNSSR